MNPTWVLLARILDIPKSRTADELVAEAMLDYRDVKEEHEKTYFF